MNTQRPISFGLWYDFRNPPQWERSNVELYHAVIDQVVHAESLGFDDVWLSEHHFCDDSYSPSMLAIGCAIAARTKKIRIGTSVLLLPLHDPVRVAEDAATLDIISNGRLELGLGIGYKVEEFIGFNVDPKERAQRMEEGIEILKRLFAGERFSFKGRHYTYNDIQLRPGPVQKEPKLWIAGFSNVAVRRAARVGHGYIATGAISPFAKTFWDELKAQGKDATTESAIANYHVSESFVENSLDAVRVFGARGFVCENLVEKDLRDSIGSLIYSGTNEIQLNLVAKSLRLP